MKYLIKATVRLGLIIGVTACSPMNLDHTGQTSGEDCTEVAMPLLSEDSTVYAGREICTQAIARYQYSEIYLQPLSIDTQLDAGAREIYLADSHPIVRAGDIRTGDRVSIHGQFEVPEACYPVPETNREHDSRSDHEYCPDPPEPAYFDVADIEVLNRGADHGSCTNVPVATLYVDPLPYKEDIVCTTGVLRIRDADKAVPLVSLTPEGYPAEDLAGVDLVPDLSFQDIAAVRLSDGDTITVRGRFGLMEDCWEGYQSGDGCIPTGAPLWIAGTDILESGNTADGNE